MGGQVLEKIVEDEENIIMELGVELCPMCMFGLKEMTKDGVNAHVYLPCIRSFNMCKNYYQCAHYSKKCRTNLQCIRYHRSPTDGLTTIKFSNTGRRRYLAELAEIDEKKML
jgi:hypothetical protein